MYFSALVLILVQTVLIGLSYGNDLARPDEVSLLSLCKNKQVYLTKKSQLASLNTQSMKSGVLGHCPSEVTSMISELHRIVSAGSENICSLELAERFRNFYVTYLDNSKDKSKKAPKSLKKFVLAYGMQMSNRCKKNMLDVITGEGNNLLKDEDIARLGQWASDKGPLSKLLAMMNEPGEIFLPTDVAGLISKDKEDVKHDQTLYIQSEASKTIRKLKETCKKRFQPIYEPLILPLTVLAGVGFNYADPDLKKEFKIPEKHTVMSKWTTVLFICEALKVVEPVDLVKKSPAEETAEGQQEVAAAGDKPKRGFLRVLTKEEADAVNEELQATPSLSLLLDRTVDELEPVVYEPNFRVTVGDLVVDDSDSKLLKSVSSFKSNKSQMDRIKGRMMRGSLLSIRSMLKKGSLTVVATAAAKATWRRLTTKKSDVEEGDANKALVKTIEEMADKSIEAELQKTTKDIMMWLLVAIIGLALLALTAKAVAAVVIGGIGVAAIFGGMAG